MDSQESVLKLKFAYVRNRRDYPDHIDNRGASCTLVYVAVVCTTIKAGLPLGPGKTDLLMLYKHCTATWLSR